ncbi:hypothetical protein [Sphingobium boeckii]|uniref:Uncharacterized protein n=1 Tax=Sphingobium boeckii TaxID=1082345 RepID=A0A7W9AHC6_9SPHN|nr:hypothetical protein [Sphingobium boeckii]MBB5685479.1 hypothetical protein [Sphingobium boeckii]
MILTDFSVRTCAVRGFSATWTAPPPITAPPHAHAHNFARAIRTDIAPLSFVSGRSLLHRVLTHGYDRTDVSTGHLFEGGNRSLTLFLALQRRKSPPNCEEIWLMCRYEAIARLAARGRRMFHHPIHQGVTSSRLSGVAKALWLNAFLGALTVAARFAGLCGLGGMAIGAPR